jgi:hypothetical protein
VLDSGRVGASRSVCSVTIILSLVTGEYAVQVSDRLWTQKLKAGGRRPLRPVDEAANKSVIVLGRDGLFAMGYSGPAHIAAADPKASSGCSDRRPRQ